MVRLEQVHIAIQLIYDAVLSPQRWNEAVAQMVAMTNSDRGFLCATQFGAPMLAAVCGLEHERASALQQELQNRLPDWMKNIPTGLARRQSSGISDCDFKRTYIYREVVEPERMFYGLILPVARQRDRESYLTLGRRLGATDYDQEDEFATTLLASHLSAALSIRSRLAGAELRDNGAFDILTRLEFGVILLDKNACPLFVNPYAEKLSSTNDGLMISHRGVSSLVLEDTSKLRAAIASALRVGAAQRKTDMGPCRAVRCYIRRRSSRLPLVIRVVPVKPLDSAGGIGSLVRVVLFVLDPERSAEIDPPVVAETFSLTRRESELAALLARGNNVAQAAAQMHIGLETARGYLKSVQGKTQTHHQGELVSLLLRGGLQVLR